MKLKIKAKILIVFVFLVVIASAVNIGIASFAVKNSLTTDLINRIVLNTRQKLTTLQTLY